MKRPNYLKRRGLLSWTLGLVLLTLASLPASTAQAYDVLRDTEGRKLSWPDREVAVFLECKDYDTLSVTKVEKTLRAAMQSWRDVQDTRLKLIWGGLVRQAPGFDIYVRFDNFKSAQLGPERLARLALFSEDGVMSRAEISLDAGTWNFTTGPTLKAGPSADLQAALTHELGHALGLAHSSKTKAAMYFFQSTPSGRVLSEDDARGLRFNYRPSDSGAIAMGGHCDTCDGDEWCKGEGRCATWPSHDSYCLQPCETHDQCPIGTSCGAWGGGKACLPNERHCAPDLVRAKTSGRCASDMACADPLICLSELDEGVCTIGCTTSCGPYGQCLNFSAGGQIIGLCLIPGTNGYGERCTRDLDCQSMLCAPGLGGGGWCTQACGEDKDCGPSSVCDISGRCARPGELPVGWPCGSGFDCKTGRCAAVSGQPWEKVCTLSCETAEGCPKGTGCTPIHEKLSLCLPFGPAADGAPCTTPGACGAGSLCDQSPIAEVGICQVSCDPFSGDASCPAGKRCVWVGSDSPEAGVCRSSGGGAIPGSTCDADNPCRVDLVCAGVDLSSATCRWDCDVDVGPGAGGACASGQFCAPLDTTSASGSRRGVCAATQDKLITFAPATAHAVNFAAEAFGLPQVKPWSAAGGSGGADSKAADSSGGGCSTRTQAGHAAAIWWLMTLTLWMVWWRRRRC